MTHFIFTTETDLGDVTVTADVDGRDVSIVAALLNGVSLVFTHVGFKIGRHFVSLEAVLLDAASDYAHDNDLLGEEENLYSGNTDRRDYSDY